MKATRSLRAALLRAVTALGSTRDLRALRFVAGKDPQGYWTVNIYPIDQEEL